jgi:hypothetical protein
MEIQIQDYNIQYKVFNDLYTLLPQEADAKHWYSQLICLAD